MIYVPPFVTAELGPLARVTLCLTNKTKFIKLGDLIWRRMPYHSIANSYRKNQAARRPIYERMEQGDHSRESLRATAKKGP